MIIFCVRFFLLKPKSEKRRSDAGVIGVDTGNGNQQQQQYEDDDDDDDGDDDNDITITTKSSSSSSSKRKSRPPGSRQRKYSLSDDEYENAEDDDPELTHGKRYWEHMSPKSYSWCLMRYAMLKYAVHKVHSFLAVIGIEAQDVAALSPLVHQMLGSFERWQECLLAQLNEFNGPPDDYIPGCNVSNSINLNGPKILKYQSMLDPANTPFM